MTHLAGLTFALGETIEMLCDEQAAGIRAARP
jgi:hypothetical protein